MFCAFVFLTIHHFMSAISRSMFIDRFLLIADFLWMVFHGTQLGQILKWKGESSR